MFNSWRAIAVQGGFQFNGHQSRDLKFMSNQPFKFSQFLKVILKTKNTKNSILQTV